MQFVRIALKGIVFIEIHIHYCKLDRGMYERQPSKSQYGLLTYKTYYPIDLFPTNKHATSENKNTACFSYQ